MSSYLTRKTPGDTSWFVHDRFGMFIHFGVYAMPARHEWVRTNEKMPDAEYDKYLRFLTPICSTRASGQERPKRPACATLS